MSARAAALVTLLLACLNALAASALLSFSQSALLNQPGWRLAKRERALSLLGADEALLTRSLVARGAFHGGAWYGYQEILSRDALDPRELKFTFRLPTPSSYLSLEYGATPEGARGVRVSRNPAFPGIAFETDAQGLFRLRRTLPEAGIRDGNVHVARFRFTPAGGELAIDGEAATPLLPGLGARLGRVGVRGGYFPSSLLHLRVAGPAGDVWSGELTAFPDFPRLLLIHLAVFALAAGALPLLRNRRWVALGNAALLALFVLTAAFFGFDWFYWSNSRVSGMGATVPHDRRLTTAIEISRDFEAARLRLTSAWYRLLGGRPLALSGIRDAGYPRVIGSDPAGSVLCAPPAPCALLDGRATEALSAREKKARRILFVGTSQLFGSGASSLDDTFFARTVRGLGLRDRKAEGLSIGLVAGRGEEVLRKFRHVLPLYRPDLVVVDMVENLTPQELPEIYQGIFSAAEAAHAKVVVLGEAVTPEAYTPDGVRLGTHGEVVPEQYQNRAKQARLRELAVSRGIPYLDLEAYFHEASVRDRGFLWWDHVHFTDAGHRLAAEWLAPKLAPGNSR